MPLDKLLKTDYQLAPILWFHQKHKEGEGVGSYFPYILLNEIPLKEIQTMFLQLAKLSGRVLPADVCPDRAHYVKNHRSTVLRENR